MGLDSYASRSQNEIELTEGDLHAFNEADISLCGGLFSGGGNDGSFRGKVYSILILEISGISIYEDWVPPEKVQEIYRFLEACDPEEAAEAYGYRNSPGDILNLRKFFKVCSERGLGLIGWY